MTKISYFFLGMIAGALALYSVVNYHLIRARDGFHIVAKQPPRMAEIYVDIRQFSPSDWAERRQLTSALVDAKEHQVLSDAAGAAIADGIQQGLPSWPNPSEGP